MKSPISIILCLYAAITLNSPALAGTASCKYERTSNYNSALIPNQIYGYMCTLSLDARDDLVTEIRGSHQRRHSDSLVDIIKVQPEYNSYLTTFPATFCNKFNKLEIIDMSGVGIKVIEDGSLDDCKDLRILRFHRNRIDKIPEDFLYENKKLLRLYITSNSIRKLPENFLDELSLLTLLDLSSNKIDHLSSNVFNDLNSLKELNLERNKLKDLNQNLFKNLDNLEKLNLNSNELSDLPIGIFSNLHNLKSLYFKYNKLTSIHAASFPLRAQISIVEFSYNKINAIDEAFISNCRVNSLSMAGNVCERDSQIRNYQMRQKLTGCFRNYKNMREYF
jgi:Leucine-rich repeat (LRR) protein